MENSEVPVFNTSTADDDFVTGVVALIDKPLGWTSFDVVRKCRNIVTRRLKVKKLKVGHAGTLDPLATGLMLVCTGKATKRIGEWMDADKEYRAVVELGRTTPSFDQETETNAVFPYGHISREDVEQAIRQFVGNTMQVPPLYSAKFVDGKRAYTLARRGSDHELQPSPINISKLEIIRFDLPLVEIEIRCSKGTYIRSLARDIGLALQNGACLTALRRTAIGQFKVDDALSPDEFEASVNNHNILNV